MAMSAIVNETRDPEPAREYRALIAGRPVVLSFATVTELRFGAIDANWGELRRRGLERDLERVVIAQADDELMTRCAMLKSQCRRLGHPLWQKVHEADRWIATTALARGLDLVSNDGVFVGTPGLSLLTTRHT